MYQGSSAGEKPFEQASPPDSGYFSRSNVTVQVLPFSSFSNTRVSFPSFTQNSLEFALSPDIAFGVFATRVLVFRVEPDTV